MEARNAPTGDEKILHIGTGSGFFAAMLGLPAISLEIDSRLAESTCRLWCNVAVKCADGLARKAFDAIVLTASAPIYRRRCGIAANEPAMTRLMHKQSSDVCLTNDILETCVVPMVNAPQPPRFKFCY